VSSTSLEALLWYSWATFGGRPSGESPILLSGWMTMAFICRFLLGDVILKAFIMFCRLEVGAAVIIVDVLGHALSFLEALGCSCFCGSSTLGGVSHVLCSSSCLVMASEW
jgi:hypothetical protein